jgi:hypothetical protein
MPSLHVHVNWVDDCPVGTVQDAARALDAIGFTGWIEFAAAIRTLTLSPKSGVQDRE